MAYAGDLTPPEAWELLRSDPRAVLVDVRTGPEWSYVGVPDLGGLGRETALVEWSSYPTGRVNERFVAELGSAGAVPEAPVLFVCRSGARSAAAAEAAAAAGFRAAYNVLDGFEGPPDAAGHRGVRAGWKAAGLPWRQS